MTLYFDNESSKASSFTLPTTTTSAIIQINQNKSNTYYPRVLCFVPSKVSSGSKLEAIVTIWLSKCDHYIITSTEANKKLNVIKVLNHSDVTFHSLWNVVHPAWLHIAKNYLNDFDWFVKLDDDSYFVPSNFKYFVKDFNPEEFYYLGHVMHEFMKPINDPKALFNLGAGHALSRASLRRLSQYLPKSDVENAAPVEKQCPNWMTWAEDVFLGECLHLAGGIGHPNHTRDEWGRERFMAFTPSSNFLTIRRP